ncbi:MAG: DNA-3-methyladenine glycosylase [Gemmatimonadales bacterium]
MTVPSGAPPSVRFYARDTESVARALLGCILESRVGGRRTAGRVVEVEAYVGPHDPAAHGYLERRTRRNDALFGPPGTAYVYRSYGVHWCFNAVTERDGFPSAVLVRALEPLAGFAVMAERRGTDRERILCAGPGRLCQALGIGGEHDGRGLARGPVRVLRPRSRPRLEIAVGPRIGVSSAADWPLRFCVAGSRWLSRPC